MAAPDPLPPDVLDALHRGDMVDAIQRLRNARDLDLREAKARIDAEARGFSSPQPVRSVLRPLPPDAARALARGDKIEAIKLARHETGLGLKEARDWVEAQQTSSRLPTGLSPGEVQRARPGTVWLWALAAVLVVAAWLFI
ncbi:MAG: ribosomal protein L7/L12 [Betaproteobacteria bacterium]